LKFTEPQIQTLAPDDASFKAGKGLASKSKWLLSHYNGRVLWGEIKGSGSKPYYTQIDVQDVAFKCSCPSRKFPCKHGIGLMLLWASDPAVTEMETEPSWVQEWMYKRVSKSEKVTETKIHSEEEQEKLDKSKQKRADDRIAGVENGVTELSLVLKDIIRTGILTLPQKDRSFFENLAARMVDAKANGLAAWVRRLGNINYAQENSVWQNEALEILGRLFLLTESFSNLATFNGEWQQSIKNLLGWSQSGKELLADDTTEIIKDTWIILGQETTDLDDIVTQRTWLLGVSTNRTALVLNFGTRFSPLDITAVSGSIIEAGVVFFPGVWKQRAVIKQTKSTLDYLSKLPQFIPSIIALNLHINKILRVFPFATDIPICIENIRLGEDGECFVLADKEGFYFEFSPSFVLEKQLNFLAISAGDFCSIAGIVCDNKILPLGIFQNQKYLLL
jgi:SWIM zinc finger